MATMVRDRDPVVQAIEFRLSATRTPAARCVSLVGEFNAWDPMAHPMARGEHGDWSLVVGLPAGVHAYLFFVDGAWYNDPADDGRVPSGWGNEYSLRVVR